MKDNLNTNNDKGTELQNVDKFFNLSPKSEYDLEKMIKRYGKKYEDWNKTISKYTYLIMLLGLGYEFLLNRASSNRVNELQGKVDNLYKQVNEMNKNKALEKK